MIDLFEARLAFLALARPSADYCREHAIDWINTQPASGGVFLAPVTPWAASRFSFNPDGQLAAICEALDETGAITDIVAWSITDPCQVWTVVGSELLGLNVASAPATYAFGLPLRLFRTPLRWLQAGCDGVAVLDMDRTARWLLDSLATTVAPEDDAHAAEYHAAQLRLIRRQHIVIPDRKVA